MIKHPTHISDTADIPIRKIWYIFNINIVRFIFTVASMGLIFAGIVEIVDDIFVKDNFNSENVTYILSGLILQFIGLLVHDSIRGRVDELSTSADD